MSDLESWVGWVATIPTETADKYINEIAKILHMEVKYEDECRYCINHNNYNNIVVSGDKTYICITTERSIDSDINVIVPPLPKSDIVDALNKLLGAELEYRIPVNNWYNGGGSFEEVLPDIM